MFTGSGWKRTYYTVDDGAPEAETAIAVAAERTRQVGYQSANRAGNTETARAVTVLVDKIAGG